MLGSGPAILKTLWDIMPVHPAISGVWSQAACGSGVLQCSLPWPRIFGIPETGEENVRNLGMLY